MCSINFILFERELENMKIVGIDNSVNSPGVVWFTLDEQMNITKKEFMGFTQVKKNATENIIHYKKKDFEDDISQYIFNRDKIFEAITKDGILPDYVAIEDYAYSANGKVFNIAESTGALKVKLYENYIPIRLYDPCSIKLFFSSYGNADKERMKQCYDNLDEGEKLFGVINEDIIDAFFVTLLLYYELKIRKGLINLSLLPEYQIRVFNRVTKNYPENILVRNFIRNN
jgi:Holliday junction resolvasome RuvABC endonuclease subunit